MSGGISSTQRRALQLLDRDGMLVRRTGGFWTTPSMPETRPGVPDDYVGTETVKALANKGLVVLEGDRYPTKAVRS